MNKERKKLAKALQKTTKLERTMTMDQIWQILVNDLKAMNKEITQNKAILTYFRLAEV